MSVHQMYVKAGACVVGDELQRCALKASACDNANDFVSSHILMTKSTAVGESCLGDTKTVQIGRCTADSACASTASACSLENDFYFSNKTNDDASECTVQGKSDAPTIYGGCTNGDELLCLWDRGQDCPGAAKEQAWLEPRTIDAVNHNACICENVVTGACLADHGNYYCAVSKEGCDKDTEFISVRDLPSNIQCRLCKPTRTTTSEPFIPSPTPNPTVMNRSPYVPNDKQVPQEPVSSVNTDDNSSNSNNNINDNNLILAVGVMATAIALLVITLIVVTVYFFSNEKVRRTVQDTSTNGDEQADDFEFQSSSNATFT